MIYLVCAPMDNVYLLKRRDETSDNIVFFCLNRVSGSVTKIMSQLTSPLKDVCKFLAKGACGAPETEDFAWQISLRDVQDDEEFPPTYFQQFESEWGVSSPFRLI